MAETPECAYRAARAVAVGARHVLTVLYTRARRDVVVAYLEGFGPAPFVWPGKDWIEEMSGCSRSQVYDHLKALEQLGAAIPGQQKIDGKLRKGWVLPLRDGVQPVPADSSEGRQQHDSEAGPTGGSAHATADEQPEVVRPAGQIDPPDVRPAGNPADRKSGPPDKTVRPAGSENPARRTNSSGPPDQNRKGTGEGTGRRTDVVDDVPNSTERRASPADRTPRVVARRPMPDAPDGQPVGGASAARVLLLELTRLYCPDDEGRRFVVANRRHLELAEQLLAVAPGPGDDPGVLANERLQRVLGYVRDFAELVRADRKQEVFWRPTMLGTTPAAGKTISAWEMLCADVDAWRRRRRDERDAAAAVQVRRERDREEAEQVQRRRMDPAEVAREAARFTGAEPERDDERLRRQGRAREADAARDEWSEIDIRRRTNEALTAAMKANGGQLSQAQAEDIRRRVRGEGATAT